MGYLVLFTIFHATAERWLGTWRWLCVVVVAHVGATYISEGVLYEGIRHGYVAESAVNTLDVGVSYGLAGIMGILVYRIVDPWRYVYLAGLLLFYGVPLIFATNFTAIGTCLRCCWDWRAIRSRVLGPARGIRWTCGIREESQVFHESHRGSYPLVV